MIDCPEHLQGIARETWQRLAAELADRLTPADLPALEIACTAYGTWREAEQQIQALGKIIKSSTGTPIQNPWLAISEKAARQWRAFAGDFGLTPSARRRLGVQTADQAGDEGQLDSLLKQIDVDAGELQNMLAEIPQQTHEDASGTLADGAVDQGEAPPSQGSPPA